MSDAALMMQYDASKKSTGIAYLLWFFLGMLGVHRFYLGQTGTGIAILAITLGSFILMAVAIGFVTIAISGIWVLVDLFLIPGMARKHNLELAAKLNMA
jgi:TM2 domain-containing membrane protein YozV